MNSRPATDNYTMMINMMINIFLICFFNANFFLSLSADFQNGTHIFERTFVYFYDKIDFNRCPFLHESEIIVIWL